MSELDDEIVVSGKEADKINNELKCTLTPLSKERVVFRWVWFNWLESTAKYEEITFIM